MKVYTKAFILFLIGIFSGIAVSWGDITIGQGAAIGTDKRGTVWYEEFQDWTSGDLVALDANNDHYLFNEAEDPSRDIVAFYHREEAGNMYFRVDFFELGFGQENDQVDLYLAIDCATGGEVWLPDFSDSQTDKPWEVIVAIYNATAQSVYSVADGDNWDNDEAGNWVGSYWRGDLDAVEFGIPRQTLIDAGWDGTSAISFQIFTTRDGTNSGAGEVGDGTESDIIDTVVSNLNKTVSPNVLEGGITSTTRSNGRAKYAIVAHANQSLNTVPGTQGHIYTDRSDLDPNPAGGLHPGFVRTLDTHEMLNVPLNMHISGSLIGSFLWAKQDPSETGYPNRDGPTFLQRCVDHATSGPGSLIGGVYAEHIMPYFEGAANEASIRQFNELVQQVFGLSASDMDVMHVPERVFHTNTGWDPAQAGNHLEGKPFEDILTGGYRATYLDEVVHLHHWFYPDENDGVTTYPGYGDASWSTDNCGYWAGGQGNDEARYHHKVHKINGVYSFMINDREDQAKFGNDDGGMQLDTRYTLLDKALQSDQAQLTLVFDDWEALAGNSFASPDPNNNADQWHNTIRWAANHPWIEVVNLNEILARAVDTGHPQYDAAWVIDQGDVFDKSLETYEWLKRASEYSYDNWYYGGALEEDFFSRVPSIRPDGSSPAGVKNYGDLNNSGTLLRDAWDAVESIPLGTNLRDLAELVYSQMIYETAWHDEDANPDLYQSRNYQSDFDRAEACTTSFDDTTFDNISGWALKLHGHARKTHVIAAAHQWAQEVQSGTQTATTVALAADIDDDTLDEYILKNDQLFVVFESWGGRGTDTFHYVGGGEARQVTGSPVSNPAEEHEGEGADNNRCSIFKDRYNTGFGDTRYVDGTFTFTADTAPDGSTAWNISSFDSSVGKRISLPDGRDVLHAEYSLNPVLGTVYTRHGLGPSQVDLIRSGQDHLTKLTDTYYTGLRNTTTGDEAFIVPGLNCAITGGSYPGAGWDNRKSVTIEQFEVYNDGGATSYEVFMAFSQASADDIDGDGTANASDSNPFVADTADTDSDGMPDSWETANGLTVGIDDSVSDLDGDGFNNLSEYLASTNPADSSSLLCITAIAREGTGGADIRLTWTSEAGKTYRVWTSTTLEVASWTSLADEPTGGASTQYLHSGGGSDTRRFYRIEVLP